MLGGLSSVNVELTSRCNKNCWMCGRRERDALVGDQEYGDMPLALLSAISAQLPSGVLVQLHNNGEPLVYPFVGKVLHYYFKEHTTNFVTNGKWLLLKADEIIGKLDTMSISIFEGDEEQEDQYEIIKGFLELKGDKKPYTTLRIIGNVDHAPYEKLNTRIITRVLHKPKGSIEYTQKPTIPEVGFCWDAQTRMAIDTFGFVRLCVRYDPEGELIIGNLYKNSLSEIWNGEKRKAMMEKHRTGKRDELPYCGNKCHYWGVPVGQ